MSQKKKLSTGQEDLTEGALAPRLPEPKEEKNEETKELSSEEIADAAEEIETAAYEDKNEENQGE